MRPLQVAIDAVRITAKSGSFGTVSEKLKSLKDLSFVSAISLVIMKGRDVEVRSPKERCWVAETNRDAWWIAHLGLQYRNIASHA